MICENELDSQENSASVCYISILSDKLVILDPI